MKKIIAFARKRQDAILNTVFVAGLLFLSGSESVC